ncbi:MAG TPA: LLM class F420-dependent oxidoreductase [Acidimicrobiales bacterium]|nr:LLM class F420-dependent oxidoreductase [Acidimicrobiales bacterium]
MRFAYGLPYLTAPPDPELCTADGLTALARAAEAAGFAAVHLSEHPAPARSWREAGGHDAMDPFVTLGLVAGVTSRLRLMTGLTVVPYRNPFLLAKAVATLDRLSGGRVELGMGTGYHRAEFAALGVDFDERNALFDEAVDVLVRAFTGEPVTYEGRHFTARDNTVLPAPVQQPHPPFWFGGNSRLTLRRVAAHGGGWLALPASPDQARHLRSAPLADLDQLAANVATVRHLAAGAGRTGPVDVMYPLSGPATRDQVDELADRGVTWVVVNGEGDGLAGALAFLEDVAGRLL